MTTIKSIPKEEFSNFFSQRDIKEVQKLNEPVFKISGNFAMPKNNPLVDIEISLRKCERVGVFRHSR